MMKIKPILRGLVAVSIAALLTACNHTNSQSHSGSSAKIHGCAGNPYLMKYDCSITRIQKAAENGNADAQYALGYMYYYGIGTVQDRETADLWIQRSAAQGQPLAQKAWSLINTGATFTDLHQAAAGNDASNVVPNDARAGNTIIQQEPADIDKLNSTVPTEPITKHLPGYQTPAPNEIYKSQGVTSGTSSETAAPPLAEHMPVHDPRLSTGAKPVVAAMNNSESAPAAAPAVANASPQQGYTVQLMASAKLSDVKDYIVAHHLEGKANYFETKLDGKPWYMLTYGNYSTVQKAQLALQDLPQNMQNHHPWVKSTALVEKEVQQQKVIA